MDTSILLPIIGLPFFGAGLILLVPRNRACWFGRIAILVPALAFILTLRCWPSVADSAVYTKQFAELPQLALSLALRADRFGVFFALLITLIGVAIAQYARHYFKNENIRRFWFLLMIFQGSMLGIAFSESLLTLFIFWEMTTISSALLIAHNFQEKSACTAASQALMVTAAGGLALLAGIVLLGQISGTDQFLKLAQNSPSILSHSLSRVALCLLLMGAFTKSAQFPFHFWLPGAMAAPIPISAYLHSATMVKAGILLLARLFPVFSESDIWQPVVGTVGLVTFVVGSWNAFRCADMKKLLAHSTVAYLGVLTAIYGYSSQGKVHGELLHIANHTFYKSSLFLLLGWFEKVAGTRDINLLDREIWYRRQPVGALLFCLAGLSIVGGPFLLSYTSKDLFFEIVLTQTSDIWPVLLVIVGSILTVAFSIKLVIPTFLGTAEPDGRRVVQQNVSLWLLIIPGLLIIPQLVGGLALSSWTEGLSEPAREWSGGLAFWQELDVKTTVKFIIFTGGFLLYFFWRKLGDIPMLEGFLNVGLRFAQNFLKTAGRMGSWLQGSHYPTHMSIMLLASATFTLVLFFLGTNGSWIETGGFGWELTPYFIFPAFLVITSSLALPFAPDRVSLMILLGVGAFGVALFYINMRAPDLAMTQLLVDTLGLIALLVVFHHVKGRNPAEGERAKPLRILVASLMGIGTGCLVLLAGIHATGERIGQQHLDLSVPYAFGRNVVNVILVDFRALDTLGEVLVLILAAVGVAALLQRSGQSQDASTSEERRL